MAEAPIPVIEVPDDISGTVIVGAVTPSGEIEFVPPSDDNPVGHIGTCRISHLCDPHNLYVQPQPKHVDTVAYFIYVAILEKRQTNLLQRAQNIEVDGMYIYAEGPKQYRVRLLERIVETEPSWFQDLMRNRVLRERQTNVSTACTPGDVDNGPSTSKRSREDISGEKRNDSDEVFPRFEWSKRDIFDRTFGEKVEVFRVDYGGPSITVLRADLYTVESVSPDLYHIKYLAIPVNVKYINFSDVNNDARLEDLRNRKQIINIKTVSEAIGDTRAVVNIFHEQNLE